ncbi:MAG: MNIO family bufferin maturase [Immundisolibacter sp.]|uniref:MNIO family bufferin maturase n=1 Tax=Immundisolibacter sp. TaxID=1934948 RepID=UPI003EDF60F5
MGRSPGASVCPMPAAAGIGLRPAHYRELLTQRPALAFVEVHSENYFGAGGPPLHYLEQARDLYPLSLHGVGLSLGSATPFTEHLRHLKRLIGRFSPALVSDHLCWGASGDVHLNDLLPLPYTEEVLALVTARVIEVQDTLGRQILVENVSTYLQYAHSTISDAQFLAELAERADCGILLDVNNLYVNARNHGWDPAEYLADLPAQRVWQLHLAGHSSRRFGEVELTIDTHDAPVAEPVWALYAQVLEHIGPRPTLIEWDANLPPLDTLCAEAARAQMQLDSTPEPAHALAG